MSVEAVREALPRLIPKINRAIVQTVELKDHCYSMHSKGTPKEINSLGARQNLRLRVGGNYGNQGEGDYFREPGRGNTKQMIIGFTRDAISHGVNGDYFDNIERSDSAIGGKLSELMKENVLKMKKERDVDFSHGDGKGTRGTVLTVDSATQATFTSEEGTRFLDVEEIYFFHHPTTGAIHGSTSGHQCTAITSTLVATFAGDITSGVTVAANDLVVHKGTADNESSFNRALYGYEYFFLDSGPYFGLDKDTEKNIRGLRVNAASKMVSFSLLEKGVTKWMYRWNMGEPDGHVDIVSPAQRSAYKLLGYNLRRVDGDSRSFDGAFTKVTDGNRTMYVNANIRPTNWFRIKPSTIERYEFKPTGVWDLDGLKMRTVQGNGSNKDEVYWIINGKEQMACVNPAENIWYYDLATTALETGI